MRITPGVWLGPSLRHFTRRGRETSAERPRGIYSLVVKRGVDGEILQVSLMNKLS